MERRAFRRHTIGGVTSSKQQAMPRVVLEPEPEPAQVTWQRFPAHIRVPTCRQNAVVRRVDVPVSPYDVPHGFLTNTYIYKECLEKSKKGKLEGKAEQGEPNDLVCHWNVYFTCYICSLILLPGNPVTCTQELLASRENATPIKII